jgi:hypothetical protein
VHRRLLVAHQHVAQPRLAVQRVVERQCRAAGIAEDRVDAAFDQRVEQGDGAVGEAVRPVRRHGGGMARGRRGMFGRKQFHALDSSGVRAE